MKVLSVTDDENKKAMIIPLDKICALQINGNEILIHTVGIDTPFVLNCIPNPLVYFADLKRVMEDA